jgi:uncharacterized protein DUF6646
MKRIITVLVLCAAGLANAQAYRGKGDIKGQVGLSLQDGGTGMHVSADFGLGANISLGLATTYLLAADNYPYYNEKLEYQNDDPDFIEKFDLKARFNAHLGNVIGLDPKMDFYPGLNLGLHNFGAHAGFRYFFTDGFGVYGEAGVPISKYGGKSIGYERLHNQFTFNIGASFNI